ncbi:toxin-antitoxin system HicB family antitoxin [uncultured Phascolarctobacterium sp.]
MTAQKKLTVRIPQELHTKLALLSKQKGLTKNSIITQVLWKLVEKQRSH